MAFLERNLVFCDEIGTAGSINAFVNVCSNTGGRAYELVLQYCVPLYVVTEPDYFYCKIQALLSKGMRLHDTGIVAWSLWGGKLFPN